ncbi:hypothetical protein [Roseateles chitinivorans]|uniref:hypothetical protein n=1 Tax=Roseateles chitinivorans TaxID=2917965 RepID=UPI003D67ED1C
MLAKLDGCSRSFDRDCFQIGTHERSLQVNVDGLLDIQGAGKPGGRVLDASRVSSSSAVMAAPVGRMETAGFVEACVNHRVAHMIDLTGPNDGHAPAWSGATGWGESCGGARSVRCQPVVKPSASVDPGLGQEASSQLIRLEVKDGEDVASQQLTWTRMPRVTTQGLPQALLAAARKTMAHQLPQGATVAFMDGNGGNLAATFAAANAIFRSHERRPLTVGDVADEVVRACALLRSRRSPELFAGRPDLLKALAEFAQLLIRRGRLIRPPSGRRTPTRRRHRGRARLSRPWWSSTSRRRRRSPICAIRALPAGIAPRREARYRAGR